jgi:hypothetical protein
MDSILVRLESNSCGQFAGLTLGLGILLVFKQLSGRDHPCPGEYIKA